jgi:PAS domain S-box-containing protein
MLENLEPSLQASPLFKSVFDKATITAIQIMDRHGFILQVNEAFSKAFGYSSEDLKGKHLKVLFTAEDQARQMPEMEIEKVNQHGFAVDKNYTIHKDGSCIWVSGESVAAIDHEGREYIVKFLQNIHDQKLLEKFLKESKDFSDSVVRSITDSLVVIDVSGRILKVNNALYNLLKINDETIEGVYLAEVKSSFFQLEELRLKIDNTIQTGEAGAFQIEWTDETNLTRHILVKASFLDGKLVNKKIVLLLNDVTEKVNAERQRDDLLAFVIHELRNPLANITLCNTLVQQSIEENDKEGAGEFLTKSVSNTRRLRTLIQELYDAIQAGSGNLHFNKSTFSFEDLINEVIEGVQISNESHVIRKTGMAAIEVNADKARISQALSNYLLNAIKYSPQANTVDVHIAQENGDIIVSVKDYGLGITDEKIPHVFERYFRADNSKKIEGLGLGLYLSKQIIDAHNGRVWVKSKVNEGSTFYFSIPQG